MWRLVLLLVPALLSAQDAREIVRRAVETAEVHDKLALNYTFIERQDIKQLESNGRTKKHEIRTFDVTMVEGSPHRRLIARADKPLSPEDDRHEREKERLGIEQRRRETAEQRAKRIAEWEKKRNRQREFMREIPNAFNFQILREERIDGRAVYVIQAEPRPGYDPPSMATGFLRKMRATLWIDKQDHGWARLDAEAFDNVSIGLFLARIHKGTRILLEQTRVNDEIWLPRRMNIAATLRVALVKWIGGEWHYDYRDYRKFEASSRVAGYEPGEAGGPR